MAFVVMALTYNFCKNTCCKFEDYDEREVKTGQLNGIAKVFLITTVFDELAFISSLVIGILGVLSILTLPTACSYALIGFSGVICALWFVFSIIGDITVIKVIFQGAFKSCSRN